MYGQRSRRTARRVKFNTVSVFEFNRVLGRQSVPDQGTFALGLGDILVDTREVSVREFEGGLEREAKDIEELSERQRMALLEMNAKDPSAIAELRELTEIRKSRKGCVCSALCRCRDKNCPCIKEGVQCHSDCGCSKNPLGCQNPNGVYRFNEEEIYCARRKKLEETKERAQLAENRARALYGNWTR